MLDKILDSYIQDKSTISHQLHQNVHLLTNNDTYLTSYWKEIFIGQLQALQPTFKDEILFKLAGLIPQVKSLREIDEYQRKIHRYLKQYNQEFINQRLTSHKSFFDGAEDKLAYGLDNNQRLAVIRDDQYNLVVAAAGSGKTSVIASRIAYLTRRRDRVNPESILALAFNTDAAQEMATRLEQQYKLTVEARTFHSFGNSIIKEYTGKKTHPKKIEDTFPKVFTEAIQTNNEFQRLFIDYLKDFLEEAPQPEDIKHQQELFKHRQNQSYKSLAGEEVRSYAEKQIADFLISHDIEYEYEARANWADVPFYPDFYLPEFNIYIEHWGLDRDMQVAEWFTGGSEKYVQDRAKKIDQFQKHKRILVETWHYEWKEKTLLKSLRNRLKKIAPKMSLQEIDYSALVKKVYQKNQFTANELQKLLITFIQHAKSNQLDSSLLRKRISRSNLPAKTLHFGRMATVLLDSYQEYMSANGWIDFEDMINEATQIINSNPEFFRNRYRHILIDEFQDISQQRLDLIQSLVNHQTDTKLFCVGDDWQSINKFAGSEVEYFVNFESYFPQATITYLETNYRSGPTVIEASSKLIKHNSRQRSKEVQAYRNQRELFKLFRTSAKLNPSQSTQKQLETCAKEIKQLIEAGEDPSQIMVLSRFNSNLDKLKPLLNKRMISDKKGKPGIRLLTIHRSKGMEAKHVFILNLVRGLYGFPSEIQDDSVLEIIKPATTEKDRYEEERRLFYVALTRSKLHVYIFTQHRKESIFLQEISDFLSQPIELKS